MVMKIAENPRAVVSYQITASTDSLRENENFNAIVQIADHCILLYIS